MYAVVAVFTMDRARDEDRRALKEEVTHHAPGPGFVSGLLDGRSARSHV